jgi:2-polyprenyl-3-methyl-5-hydroxy-6-metoxy-1,4-benzoquinol methylase
MTDLTPVPSLSTWRLAPGALILDLGCGTGLHARALATQGFRIIGLDVDLDAVETARTLCDEDASGVSSPESSPEYLVARAEHLPFGDGVFDAVICLDVLHWCADEAAFRQVWGDVWRALKPSGLFVVRCRARQDEARDTEVALQGPWFLPTRALLHDVLVQNGGAWVEPPSFTDTPGLTLFVARKTG